MENQPITAESETVEHTQDDSVLPAYQLALHLPHPGSDYANTDQPVRQRREPQPLMPPPAYQPVQVHGEGVFQQLREPSRAGCHYRVTVPRRQLVNPSTRSTYLNRQPDNHLHLAMFALLCCSCWPTIFCAVIAIVYSLQVDLSWEIGHQERARAASKDAKTWASGAIILGAIFMFIAVAGCCGYGFSIL